MELVKSELVAVANASAESLGRRIKDLNDL